MILAVNGNHWKAVPLNSPYTITHETVIEFDAMVSDPAEFHTVCLDEDLSTAASKSAPCVNFMTPTTQSAFKTLTTTIIADEQQKLIIPFGQMMNLAQGETLTANYLAFIQDNDVGDKRGGESTISKLRIYEEDRMDVSISLFGQDVAIPNVQASITSSGTTKQDSIDHVMGVSNDGKSITLTGNNWKMFTLDAPFEVTPDTVLKFTFSVPHEAEGHVICLLQVPYTNDNRHDCFSTSGRDITGNNGSWRYYGRLAEGGTMEYTIIAGSHFTGTVNYIGFVQDNDAVYTPSRAEGERLVHV